MVDAGRTRASGYQSREEGQRLRGKGKGKVLSIDIG